MKKLIDILGSMKLTLILLLLVALWFALGGVLSVSSQYGNTFRQLNDQLLGKCLFGLPSIPPRIWSPLFHLDEIQQEMLSGLPSPNAAVVGWLWGAFIIMSLLGLNLIFGTKHWFVDLFKKRLNFKKFLLLAVHVLFGMVLIGHLISAFWGYKRVGEAPVVAGQALEFLDYALRVDEIIIGKTERFTPLLGKAQKNLYTPDRFLHQNITLSVTVSHKGAAVFKGQLSKFKPLSYEDFVFSLSPFSFRSQVSHDFMSGGVGEKIVVAKNPGVGMMIVCQPLWILFLICYAITILFQKTRIKNPL